MDHDSAALWGELWIPAHDGRIESISAEGQKPDTEDHVLCESSDRKFQARSDESRSHDSGSFCGWRSFTAQEGACGNLLGCGKGSVLTWLVVIQIYTHVSKYSLR